MAWHSAPQPGTQRPLPAAPCMLSAGQATVEKTAEYAQAAKETAVTVGKQGLCRYWWLVGGGEVKRWPLAVLACVSSASSVTVVLAGSCTGWQACLFAAVECWAAVHHFPEPAPRPFLPLRLLSCSMARQQLRRPARHWLWARSWPLLPPRRPSRSGGRLGAGRCGGHEQAAPCGPWCAGPLRLPLQLG